jgi:general stress protein YciG
MAEKGAITVREAGRRGGVSTKKKYGPEFYHSIGKKGGETTKQRHGREHYEKIGKKGGQRVKQLIAQAKRMK